MRPRSLALVLASVTSAASLVAACSVEGAGGRADEGPTNPTGARVALDGGAADGGGKGGPRLVPGAGASDATTDEGAPDAATDATMADAATDATIADAGPGDGGEPADGAVGDGASGADAPADGGVATDGGAGAGEAGDAGYPSTGDDTSAPEGAACAVDDAVQARTCGKCGTQKRVCLREPGAPGRVWLAWGACLGEVDAGAGDAGYPGSTSEIACGMCGTRRVVYDAFCSPAVGSCVRPPTAVCEPGARQFQAGLSCETGGRVRTCLDGCVWGRFGEACVGADAADAGTDADAGAASSDGDDHGGGDPGSDDGDGETAVVPDADHGPRLPMIDFP